MRAIIKETKNGSIKETVIEDICIVEHGYSYGIHDNYEYLPFFIHVI